MSLEITINNQLKEAMKAKDKVRLDTLRGIKKELLELKTAKGSDGQVSEEAEMKLLNKMLKQRTDSAAIYKEQKRDDLVEVELSQASIVKEFLPEQLSEQELEAELVKLIAELGVNNMSGMGKAMGVATKKFAGKADGKLISEIVRKLLK